MYLSALELTGFKSFAKRTQLTFERGITCIVGPNGSGKSAAADAIRWVFGEQSLKSIRAKRSEDVIFAGSQSRARLGMADVTLMLSEAETAGLDMSELAITRTIDRSGQSEYRVNGRPVRLHDLAELLAKAGFAQKSYTVIPQGMSDAFVNASPQERRQMFEDATGVTPLLLKQQHTARKLEATKAEILRARDVLRELEPRLRSLKRQASRARSRAEVETALRAAEETYAAHRWSAFAAALHSADEKIRAVEARIRAVADQLAQLQTTERAALVGTERLPDLRRELARLREEERTLLLELARAEARAGAEVDWIAEELTARQKEREKLSYELREVQSVAAAARSARARQDGELATATAALLGGRHPAPDAGASPTVRRALADLRAATERLASALRSTTSPLDRPALLQELDGIERAAGTLASELGRVFDPPPPSDDLPTAVQRLRKILDDKGALDERVATLGVREAALAERIRAIDERLTALRKEQPRAAATDDADARAPADIRTRLTNLQRTLAARSAEADQLEATLLQYQREQQRIAADQQRLRDVVHAAEEEKAAFSAERAAVAARQDDLVREVTDTLGTDFVTRLRTGTVSRAPSVQDPERLPQEIARLRKQIVEIGGIDTAVLEEEASVEHRVTDLRTQLADLERARKNLLTASAELTRHVHERFTTAFRAMDEGFHRHFRDIFGGGRASLSLVKPRLVEHVFPDVADGDESPAAETGEDREEDDPSHVHALPAGVEIHVHPPGKKLQSLAQLSGGEKALTSIALLFAILSERASPFVVLDEVDAALDEVNSRRFARLLKDASQRTQFIVITHNRATMEAADVLYGVTMGEDGVSQLLSVKLEEVPESAERGHVPAAAGR